MIRTGIFGGTFHPLHYGHLGVADYFLRSGQVDEVWFVVSPLNPLKAQENVGDARQRLDAVRQALEGHPGCHVCDVEFSLPTPSYMVTTLQTLSRQYPDREFALIIGGDNLDKITCWKDFDYILSHYDCLVYPRPGSSNQAKPEWPRVKIFPDAPQMDISSTRLRAEIQNTETQLRAEVQNADTQLRAEVQNAETPVQTEVQNAETPVQTEAPAQDETPTNVAGSSSTSSPSMKQALAQYLLRLLRWRCEDHFPEVKRCIVAIAPHTSNWDFVYGKLSAVAAGRETRFLIKSSWFFFPLNLFFKAAGGIPVYRSRKGGHTTDQVAELYQHCENLCIGITPEGTRKAVSDWKKGYYYIAKKAGVPILTCRLDYGKRLTEIAACFQPGDDEEADLNAIKESFRGTVARKPRNFTL